MTKYTNSLLVLLALATIPPSFAQGTDFSRITKVEKMDSGYLLSDRTGGRFVVNVLNGRRDIVELQEGTILLSAKDAKLGSFITLNSDGQKYKLISKRKDESITIDIPELYSRHLPGGPRLQMLADSGTILLVFPHSVISYKDGHWLEIKLQPTIATRFWNFTKLMCLSRNILYFACLGGEYGKKLLAFDLATKQWKLILDDETFAGAWFLSSRAKDVILFSDDQLYEIDGFSKITKYSLVRLKNQLRSMVVSNADEIMFVDEAGRILKMALESPKSSATLTVKVDSPIIILEKADNEIIDQESVQLMEADENFAVIKNGKALNFRALDLSTH